MMKHTITHQISECLEELSDLYPEMRFGQLVAFVAFIAKGPVTSAVWDVEDEEFLKAAKEHLQMRVHPIT